MILDTKRHNINVLGHGVYQLRWRHDSSYVVAILLVSRALSVKLIDKTQVGSR